MNKKAAPGKTRITIRLDDDLLQWFRAQVRSSGGSYQTLINLSLRDHIAREPLEATLRRVVRQELAREAGTTPESAYTYGPLSASLVADADADADADAGGASSEYGAPVKRKRGARRRREPRGGREERLE